MNLGHVTVVHNINIDYKMIMSRDRCSCLIIYLELRCRAFQTFRILHITEHISQE